MQNPGHEHGDRPTEVYGVRGRGEDRLVIGHIGADGGQASGRRQQGPRVFGLLVSIPAGRVSGMSRLPMLSPGAYLRASGS